jgi:hypothetical protein
MANPWDDATPFVDDGSGVGSFTLHGSADGHITTGESTDGGSLTITVGNSPPVLDPPVNGWNPEDPGDLNVLVSGKAIEIVNEDVSQTYKSNHELHVDGDQTIDVIGNLDTSVDGNETTEVKGNVTIDLGDATQTDPAKINGNVDFTAQGKVEIAVLGKTVADKKATPVVKIDVDGRIEIECSKFEWTNHDEVLWTIKGKKTQINIENKSETTFGISNEFFFGGRSDISMGAGLDVLIGERHDVTLGAASDILLGLKFEMSLGTGLEISRGPRFEVAEAGEIKRTDNQIEIIQNRINNANLALIKAGIICFF